MTCEHEYQWDEQQSEPHKGHEYYFCPKCQATWILDPDTEELIPLV